MDAATHWMAYHYQVHMKEAQGLDDKTIDARLRHLWLFVEPLGDTPLNKVRVDDIKDFKARLHGPHAGGHTQAHDLAPKTIVQICHDLRHFFEWLIKQDGYRSMRSDISDYFRPDRRTVALAHARPEKFIPSPEDLRHLITSMPGETWCQRRDRAVIACFFLSGVRVSALISLRLKHIDLERRLVIQDAREVSTKFSKTMRTVWFPVGEDIAGILRDWVTERRNSNASPDAPLFPATPSAIRSTRVPAETFWTTPGPVRKIIKAATADAGMPCFNPHAIRSTIAGMFFGLARSLEGLKALSQNLGHEDIRTTFEHYANMSEERQHELVHAFWDQPDADEELTDLIRQAPADLRNLCKTLLRRG